MGKIGKYIGWFLLGLLCLVMTLYLVIQIPFVQTRISKYALKKLTQNIPAEFSVGNVNIHFFNRLHIEDFAIVSKDTLISIRNVDARFSLRGLLDKSKAIKSLDIDDGVFNLIFETDSSTNIDRIFPPSSDTSSLNLNLSLKKIHVGNFRFNMVDPFHDPGSVQGQMNFADLAVRNISFEASDINIAGNTVKADIDNISGDEKSGFKLKSTKGNFLLDQSGATLFRPDIVADGSHFRGDFLKLGFTTAKDLKYFLDKVEIRTRFNNSTLAMRTIGRFAPDFLKSDLMLLASGEAAGTVRNMLVKRAEIVTQSGETAVSVANLTLKGLPNAFHTSVNGEIKNLSTNGKDLSNTIADLSDGKKIDFLESMPRMQVWNYSGKVSGTLGHIVTDGVLSNGSSRVAAHAAVNAARDNTAPLVACRVDANDVNLYQFTGSSMLGAFSGKGSVKVEMKGGSPEVTIDSLNVRKIGINGYNLTGIFAKGVYAENIFDGKLICHDPALDLMFQGNISTEFKDGSTFNFYANIPYADLNALKIDTRDSIAEISTFISADLFADSENNMFGYLKMDNTTYTNSHGKYNIGNLDATSLYENDRYVINLVSDFAKARYEGTRMIDSFIYQFRHQVLRRHFSNLLKPYNQLYANERYNQDYSLTLKTLNTQGICSFILPGLYIQNGSSVRIKVTEDDHYRVTVSSGRLAYEDNYLKNFRLNISDRDSSIAASLFTRQIAAAGVTVDSTRLFANLQDNKADISLNFHNDSTIANQTNLRALVSILRDSTIFLDGRPEHMTSPIAVNFRESDITLRGSKWYLRPSELIYSDSLIVVNDFRLENKDQILQARGTLSQTRPDSLGIAMDNFDISLIDQFLDDPLGLGGKLSGKALVSLHKDNTQMFAAFHGDDILVNNSSVGALDINAAWSAEQKHYNIDIETLRDGQKKLDLTGFFRPSDSYVEFDTDFNGVGLNYFEPLLDDVVSNTGGTLTGNLKISGPLDDISLESRDCRFNKFKFTVDYLKVPFTLDGPFSVDDNGVELKNCMLTDSLGGNGRVSGGITYNKLKDIKIDVGISLNNMLSLNTLERDNEDFYGTVFSSGNVNIKGDLSRIRLDVNARTNRKTLLHIPLSGASSASSSNILTFVQEKKAVDIDPYDTLYFARRTKVSKPMEIDVNLNATATPDASIWLEIDKSTGDIMKANGNGRIGIRVNPSKDVFRLSGNYAIEEGSYHFVLMGLASRDFTIKPGSSVTLNGKIGNTALDIEAVYSTKASIDRLIADSLSLGSNRQVDATIKITGLLDNPQIKFGIDIPDLDPTTKLLVQNALNTEDKMQKQFASLIAFGSFTPEIGSGISSSSSSALYSNATSMIVGQVNNLLMQLGIPLDLGFSYQQGGRYSNDAFEVAVSTQLFNNRVIINGSMGNDPYSYATGNDVKGNLDIQVKLDRRGKVRMTFFSHATDFYSNYLDMSQRTGIGVAYQHEFNSFKDLFRRRSAAQKEYEKMQSIKEKEERKAAREQKREERRRLREESKSK